MATSSGFVQGHGYGQGHGQSQGYGHGQGQGQDYGLSQGHGYAQGHGQGQGHGEVLEDYWREFEEIEQDKELGELDEEELPKTPDEGEKEAQWLKDAGYEFIVTKLADGRDLSDDELEALTSSLSRHQAEAVKKRINTLTVTLRKKRGAGKVHVKNIFLTPDNSSPEPPSPSSTIDGPAFPTGNEKTPSRQRPASFVLNRKGGYKLEGAVSELAKSVQQGVEALSFKERGTFHRPPNHRAHAVSMPIIADTDISSDFHLEQKENQLFEAKNDPLGVTFISDLSETDVPKIRSLALIELTALFDLYDITYSQPKRKKKARDHGLFGVPLQVLVEHDQRRVPGVTVPLVFQAMVTHLCQEAVTTEGILRIPGNVSRVKQLRQELEEKFYHGTFQWGEVMPNDCAALLKMFLRELPTPLLTYDYLEAFPQVENIPKALEQLKALNLLVLLLPTEHREVLKMLLQFLRTIVSHSDANRMGLNNICMIMAPNLFLPPAPKATGTTAKVKVATLDSQQGELLKATKTSGVIKMLIHYQHVLWMVPGAFLTQVRHQYTSATNRRAREKMKKKKKKDKLDDSRRSEDGLHGEGVIQVQAPGVSRNPCIIHLDDRLTAADVVARVRTELGYSAGGRGSHTQPLLSQGTNSAQFPEHKTYLYEVGGNIGERLLDPQTRMLQLYHINPTADWVVRFNVHR